MYGNRPAASSPDWQVVVRDHVDVLGEGVTWSAHGNCLLWVDILRPAICAYHPDSGECERWSMPEAIGWIIERRGRDDFVVGLKGGFAKCCLNPLSIERIGNPEPLMLQNRLNDACADRQGRIWAGTKNDRDEEPTGALYRLDTDLRWHRLDSGYVVANGPAFSVDGRTMYHTDSARRTIFSYRLSEDGTISDKREFIRFPPDWGYPDGMTVDANDGIWVAHWDGGRVSRFHPDGTLDRCVYLPVSRPTNCAFAGAELNRMFVTSASVGVIGEPLAGSLFEVMVDARGVPPNVFGG